MTQKITQILLIHGGETFKNRDDYLNYLKNKEVTLEQFNSWSGKYLVESLGDDFEVIKPRMPLKEDAKYEDWKIMFEKYVKLLNEEIILIGNSLGSIFLAKYLSENNFKNKFNKKIISVYLVCPPYDNSIPGEDLVGGFELKDDLSLIETNCNNVNLMFSTDDDCVPVTQAKGYIKRLPNSNFIFYDDKNGHFRVEEFSELVEMIKEDVLKN